MFLCTLVIYKYYVVMHQVCFKRFAIRSCFLQAAQPQRYTLSSKRACCIIEELPDNAEVDVKHTASHCGGLQSFEHCLRYDADTDDSNDDLTIRVGSLDVWVGSTKAAAAPPQCMNKKMVPAGWNHDQYLAYNIDVECGLEHWAVKQEKIAALESMNVYTFLKGAFVKQWSCESFQVRGQFCISSLCSQPLGFDQSLQYLVTILLI